MKRRLVSLLTALIMIIAILPAASISAETDALEMGSGGLVLDTDPAGGYEGDYVLIYNPATSSYTSYSTGDMSGRIETAPDPYAKSPETNGDDLYRIDVDAKIAQIDAHRPKIDTPEALKVSYNVGDTRNFTISSYSPGPTSLNFKCVAKGDHCYVWTPSQNLSNYYPLDVLDPTYPQLVCDEFESKFDQMNSSFGDHDNGSQGDGRINLMYYNIDDGWNINVNTGYVAGYFSQYDYSSNGLPMIHVDTYPCVYYVNAQGEERYNLANSFSVFCHEYQHLINYSQTGGMDTWLNECMSAAAEEICYPGSSIVSRIQSWENYYYNDNDDWLNPPHEFGYTPEYELHNGYSMYGWSNNLDYVLPLYSQVSMFAQYLFTHYGNTIFRQITQAYSGYNGSVNAISTATGMNTSELVKNFRIAVTANDPDSFDGLYGFVPQPGYDPAQYHDVANPYDLLSPVIYTGNSCSISGGGSITVKPIGGVYNPPSGASSNLVYVGITRNLNTEPVSLEGIALSPANATTYIGENTSISIIRTPLNAIDYDAEWSISDTSIATIVGAARSATVTGVSEGRVTVTCRATDRQTGRVFTAYAQVNVNRYPTLDEALNVPGGTLTFTGITSYPWEVNTEYEGRLCANSTNQHTSSTTSSVQTTIAMQAGESISFDWAVSSEGGYDKLIFYVNNSTITNINGSADFTTYTWTASGNGTYTFKWSYEKDYSVDYGRDTGYLDNVSYSGDPGSDILMGDVDMNGTVNSADALLLLRYIMDLEYLNSDQLLRADVTQDGAVHADDALLILRRTMDLV
ncbi:MAG: Ig-like domain-containing protein [Clostridia bacterium]|nr:Ig-like domain-containing protein [Clostridia bacterium]